MRTKDYVGEVVDQALVLFHFVCVYIFYEFLVIKFVLCIFDYLSV